MVTRSGRGRSLAGTARRAARRKARPRGSELRGRAGEGAHRLRGAELRPAGSSSDRASEHRPELDAFVSDRATNDLGSIPIEQCGQARTFDSYRTDRLAR